MLENRVLRITLGPKTNEIIGGWIKLHNEGIHNFYSLHTTTKSMRMVRVGYVARVGEKKNA
jgi:hypothetical protein